MEVFVDDDSKLTLHGLSQHYVKLRNDQMNRKLFDLLDVLEFNQVNALLPTFLHEGIPFLGGSVTKVKFPGCLIMQVLKWTFFGQICLLINKTNGILFLKIFATFPMSKSIMHLGPLKFRFGINWEPGLFTLENILLRQCCTSPHFQLLLVREGAVYWMLWSSLGHTNWQADD